MTESKPDITETIRNEGINLKQRGRDLWACCPFHVDRTPSLKVDVERQRFKCFGCGEGGDVIDFIQKLHNLDFKDALRYLGMKPGKPAPIDPKMRRKRELLADFEQWRRDKYNDACDFYNDIWHVLRACKDMEKISQHAPMIHQLSQIENEILVLSEGNHAEQYELYSAGF